MTGSVVSTNPSGWKPSSRDRLPSWKTHTSAPNAAVIESVFMTIALSGQPDRAQEHEQDEVGRDHDEQAGPREVRRDPAHRVADVGGAATDQDRARPAGGASGPVGSRRSCTSARASSRFGPYAWSRVKAVRSPFVVAARAAGAEAVGRSARARVEQLVLGQARSADRGRRGCRPG